MNTTNADHYFLKALDNYCHDLESVCEYLNYALSYDEFHAASNCLMGCVHMHWVKDFKTAAHYFEMAFIGDRDYVETYKHFSLLKIWTGDYQKANKIIEAGLKLRGMDKAVLYARKALIYENLGNYQVARSFLKKAYNCSFSESYTTFFDKEMSRIKKKIKMRKKRIKALRVAPK